MLPGTIPHHVARAGAATCKTLIFFHVTHFTALKQSKEATHEMNKNKEGKREGRTSDIKVNHQEKMRPATPHVLRAMVDEDLPVVA